MKKSTYILGGIIVLIIIIAIASSGGGKKETEPEQQLPQEQAQEQTQVEQEPASKVVSYKIIEEEDISYSGCKRVGIRIVVPDEADKADVNYTLKKIIDSYKADWQDITVWAYKDSEEEQVGKIPYTMGMKEYSTCE